MSQHRIYGVLARTAWVARDSGGNYALHVDIRPSASHVEPIVAKWDFGHDTPGAQAADRAARHMRQGARVYVHCLGIGLGHTLNSQAAIRCIGVDRIELLDVPVNAASALDQATT